MLSRIRFKNLLILLLFALSVEGQSHRAMFAIRNVTLIDMLSEQPRSGMTVVVSGNRISAVGKNLKIPREARAVDGSGKFLMPGLWDGYTYTLDAVKEGTPFLTLMIAQGVTSVRDSVTAADAAEIERLQNDLEAGRVLGPRLFYGGRHINGTNPGRKPQLSFEAANEAEAARLVEKVASSGVDYVSLGSFLPLALVPAVVAAARKRNLPVIQWVSMNSYADASNAGVNCIEHFADLYRTTSAKREEYFAANRERRFGTMTADQVYSFFGTLRDAPDKKFYNQTLQTLARNRTCVITNFAEGGHSIETLEFPDQLRRRYKSKKQLEQLDAAIEEKARQRRNNDFRTGDTAWKGLLDDIRNMQRAGVPIVAGTQSDENGVTSPGVWLHDELYWFVQAGLTPFEALKTATVNPARLMMQRKDLGTIERGMLADMVLLDANPLADISNTRKINAVVANGRLLTRDVLDKMLGNVEVGVRAP